MRRLVFIYEYGPRNTAEVKLTVSMHASHYYLPAQEWTVLSVTISPFPTLVLIKTFFLVLNYVWLCVLYNLQPLIPVSLHTRVEKETMKKKVWQLNFSFQQTGEGRLPAPIDLRWSPGATIDHCVMQYLWGAILYPLLGYCTPDFNTFSAFFQT